MNQTKKPKCGNANCSVSGCHSLHRRESHLSYHFFPKKNVRLVSVTNKLGMIEKIDRKLAWERVLLRTTPATVHIRVCSLHFKKEDYILPDQKNKRARLKCDAVPSCNLPKPTSNRIRKGTTSRPTKRRNINIMMCFAPTCKHYTEKHACTYFVFPKDTQEFKKWVKLIRRKDREPSKHSRICSCHFVDGDRKNGPTIFNYNVGKQFEPVEVKSRKKGQRRNKQQKLNAIPPVIQEQETSEPPFDIKQEITIDEPVLEDYIHFPKLETFENSSTEISYEQDPLLEVEIQVPQETDNISSSTSSNSFTKRRKVENYINFPKLEPLENSSAGTGYEQNPLLEVEIQAPQEMDNISSSASSKSFTKGRKVDYINFPKLETLENSSTGTGYEQNPLSEVEIEASQEMENISSNTSSKSFTKRRKVIENDIGVEEGHDVLDTVQVKLENEDDHVDYGMYIASRLQNANQSDRAIAMAKQKIELILSDLEMGIFEMSLH